MLKESITGGNLDEETEERLITDIKKSDLFHDILENNKPGSTHKTGYSSGTASFSGYTDLRLGVGKFNYELEWTKSKFSVAGKETWEVQVHIWDDYNYDKKTSNYDSFAGILNYYGLIMQNTNVFTPYEWHLNFMYVYVVD